MRERINLKQRLGLDNPESEALVAQFREQMDIAQKLYDMRTERGLSQEELAALVRIAPSVISSMEESDYSLRRSRQILEKVAKALGYDASPTFTSGVTAGST